MTGKRGICTVRECGLDAMRNAVAHGRMRGTSIDLSNTPAVEYHSDR